MSFAGRSSLSRCFGLAGSIAVHCTIGWALFAMAARQPGNDRPRDRAGEHALVVQLLPLPGTEATAAPATPGPATATTAGSGRAASTQRAARAAPDATERAPAAPADPGAAPGAAGPATAGAPPLAGEESLRFRTQLLRHIERFRRYPEPARPAEGIARVAFAMGHDGRVDDIWIEISSGSALLDEEAVAAVLRAQPLPRPPASWPSRFSFTLPIGFALK